VKSFLIVVGVASCLAAIPLGQKVMGSGGSVSALDIAGTAGAFVVWLAVLSVLLLIIRWMQQN
jgi:hypothetical protein